jgi:hemerythrin
MQLGVPEVDFEHKELIDVINALGELIRSGASPDAEQALLGDIHGKIEGHFALEEKIMRDRGFKGYEAHKEDHDRLLEQIRDIMTDAKTMNDQTLREQLSQRLTTWFTEHFKTLDRSFHSQSDH